MSGLAVYTLAHVVISLAAIAAGFVVVGGLLTATKLDRWTAVFLAATLATSLTGFGFPTERLLPSHVVGILSLFVLAAAFVARYRRRLAGAWRPVYVVGAVLALHLNVFVLIVQVFMRVPALHALAPTQSEPPFAITQAVVLAVFVAVAIAAVIRFRVEPLPPAARVV